MNFEGGTYSRQRMPEGSRTGDGVVWLSAMALAITVVATACLPVVLILPAVAVGLYGASSVSVIATRRSQPARTRRVGCWPAYYP